MSTKDILDAANLTPEQRAAADAGASLLMSTLAAMLELPEPHRDSAMVGMVGAMLAFVLHRVENPAVAFAAVMATIVPALAERGLAFDMDDDAGPVVH